MTRSAKCRLYALGSNGEGQLGVGHQTDLSEPQPCKFRRPSVNDVVDDGFPDDDVVEKLVAGGNHTVILTEKGRVYAAGSNEDGRCGSSETERALEFTAVAWAEGRSITDVAATWEATFLVEDARKVWVCGRGDRGELGLGTEVNRSQEPQIVFGEVEFKDSNDKVVAIAAGMGHVVLLLSNGRAFGWGGCRKGQLGPALSTDRIVWTPHQIDLPTCPCASGLAAGRDFTLVWNSKSACALLGELKGIGDTSQVEAAVAQSTSTAGWSTIYALHQNTVRGFGPGRRGQLPPINLPSVTMLAAGSEHCVAVFTDGRVAVWGWGEHGNCGLPIDQRGNVVNGFNILSIPTDAKHVVRDIGAGCATTFVWTTDHG